MRAGGGARRAARPSSAATSTSSSSSRSPTARCCSSGSRSAPSRRTGPTTRPRRSVERLEIYERETAPLVEYYRTTRGNVVGIHADRTIDEVFAEIRAALDQVAARDHPQVAGRDRADGARRPRSSPTTLALVGEHVRPGVTTAELDELAEEFIAEPGRLPDVQGLPRLPGGDVHLAELDDRPRDPRAVRARPRATSSRSTSASRSTASSPTRRSRSRSARSRPTRSGCSRPGRRRSRPAIEQCRRRQPAVGHLARGPAGDGERRLLGRPQPRRARRRALDARGSADPELRRAGPRARCSPRA